MIKYYFFSKADETKEPISRKKAESLVEAMEYFAKTKNLPLDKFLQLYEVAHEDNSRTKG